MFYYGEGEMRKDCNLHENQRKAGTLCRSMHCEKCPPYRESKSKKAETTNPETHLESEIRSTKDLLEIGIHNKMSFINMRLVCEDALALCFIMARQNGDESYQNKYDQLLNAYKEICDETDKNPDK